MPYAGRGGAGNIQVVQQQTQQISTDVEADLAAAAAQSQPAPPRSEPEYAHHGRGGAGNWHSPRELSENGVYKDNVVLVGAGAKSDSAGKTVAEEPVRFAGRGGSGNYAFDSAEMQERALRKRVEEEEQRKVLLREKVEKGVEDMLAMPPKAKLSGPRGWD